MIIKFIIITINKIYKNMPDNCELCCLEKKIVPRYCSKVCKKNHPICRECLDKIVLDGCSYCRKNIYIPDPNKENYLKNLGMLHEFQELIKIVSEVELLKTALKNCIAVNVSLTLLFSSETKQFKDIRDDFIVSSKMFCKCKTDKIHINLRAELLEDIEIIINSYISRSDRNVYDNLCYVRGRKYAINYLKTRLDFTY